MILLVITLYALFAAIFPLQKQAMVFASPVFIIGIKSVIAGSALLIGQKAIYGSIKLEKSSIKLVFIYAIMAFFLTNFFEILGLELIESFKSCLIYSLSPFLSALLAYFLLKERLNSYKWLGLVIGFAGMIPIMANTGSVTTLTTIGLGELYTLVAVLCSVVGWIILKMLLEQNNHSLLHINGCAMLIGGLGALIGSFMIGELWDPVPVNDYYNLTIYVLFMCLISNVICYNLFGYLLKHFTASFMTFAGLVTPLFASFYGYMFLGEKISAEDLIAFALFMVGLSIFYYQERKNVTSNNR